MKIKTLKTENYSLLWDIIGMLEKLSVDYHERTAANHRHPEMLRTIRKAINAVADIKDLKIPHGHEEYGRPTPPEEVVGHSIPIPQGLKKAELSIEDGRLIINFET
jgi:hypothetical protein